jgi:hypothetical protein
VGVAPNEHPLAAQYLIQRYCHPERAGFSPRVEGQGRARTLDRFISTLPNAYFGALILSRALLPTPIILLEDPAGPEFPAEDQSKNNSPRIRFLLDMKLSL